jgi:hypothetical protein
MSDKIQEFLWCRGKRARGLAYCFMRDVSAVQAALCVASLIVALVYLVNIENGFLYVPPGYGREVSGYQLQFVANVAASAPPHTAS